MSDDLLNTLGNNDELNPDKPKGVKGKKRPLKNLGKTIIEIFRGPDEPDEEDNVGVTPEENTRTKTPAEPLIIPKAPPTPSKPAADTPLAQWVGKLMNQYDENIAQLTDLEEDLAVEITHGQSQKSHIHQEWVYESFDKPIVPVLRSSIKYDTGVLNFDRPPIIEKWHYPYHSSDYNYLVSLEDKPYQLRIVSRLPLEALSYARGTYLEAYLMVKGAGRWCYPDRRLQGIPEAATDALALSFKKFEQDFLEIIYDADSVFSAISGPNTESVTLYALARIFDRIPTTVLPREKKPIDWDKGSELTKSLIVVRYDGKIRSGEEAISWEQIATNLVVALVTPNNDNLFEKVTPLAPLLVIEKSKSILFSLETAIVKEAIQYVYSKIKEGLSSDLSSFTHEQEEKEIEFRFAVMNTIFVLSVEFEKYLTAKNTKAPKIEDLPPTDEPLD